MEPTVDGMATNDINMGQIPTTLPAESLRSFLDKSGKRKAPSSFSTYLGKIEATLLAG